jgi:hypothetical protein
VQKAVDNINNIIAPALKVWLGRGGGGRGGHVDSRGWGHVIGARTHRPHALNLAACTPRPVQGFNPVLQRELDEKMKELDGTDNKGKLGANAILAVSLAACKVGGGPRVLGPVRCTTDAAARCPRRHSYPPAPPTPPHPTPPS